MGKNSISLIRAWVRYDEAMNAYNQLLRRQFQISGLQLAILRMVAEHAPLRLRELRSQLSLHPATLGQAVDSLVKKELLERYADPQDARGRVVAVTASGKELIAAAPLAGPVRIRYAPEDAEKYERLEHALNELVELFGLEPWSK
ncbi:MarR family winged helix-turn-helix transcriptional regulator [Paenibacillus donghaensis]|nr:MarR family transcriptional regulator [Paenibacillus donghaensis]